MGRAAGGLGDMSTATPGGVGNGGVLAIAGIVAGAIGGIAMAVARARGRRDEPASRIAHFKRQAAAQVDTRDVERLATEVATRASAAVQAAAPAVRSGSQQAGERARDETQRVTKFLAERARETQSALGVLARDAQSALAEQLEKREEVADRASSIFDDLSKRSRKGAKSLRAQSETYVTGGRQLAHEVSDAATGAAHTLVPEVRDRVEKQIVPKLQDLSGQATDRAHDVYDVARERAQGLRQSAEKDVLPAVSDFTVQARESLGVASHRLSDEASDIGERLSDASSVAAERATEIGRKAQHGTKQAADATLQGGRDVGSIIVWLVIGGAIIYYALLNEQQRERVKRLGQSAFSESREVYKDIQGRDEEFT